MLLTNKDLCDTSHSTGKEILGRLRSAPLGVLVDLNVGFGHGCCPSPMSQGGK